MINKINRLYILLALFSTAGVIAFADQPSSSLDDKPSVDSAVNAEVQVPVPPAGATAADTQTSYLYDLKKLIEKSKENIKEVNEKIKEQAVLKRNQKREERAREYYEKGVELTNEGKLDEAREYFEKSIRITEHPEMAGYIKESQRRLKQQEAALQAQEREHDHQIKQDENAHKEDVEEAYKEAVDLYKQKKYHPAKDAFEHVDEIAPGYRATDSYLKILEQDINIADAVAVKQQAVEIAAQQKDAEAARAKEKAMWLAQIEEKEKERKEAVDKQAAEVYDQAVDLYKRKKFAEAKKKFEEVSWVIPDYKATMKYLARIDHDAQVEQERVAKEQQKALQEQRWEETVEQKKQEAQHQKELEAKALQHQKDLQEQAQFLYTAAVSLFDKKNMDEALGKFNDIEKLLPDFKSTRMYIARIEQQKIGQQKQQLGVQNQAQELKDKTDQAQKIYDQALDSYRAHRWAESRAQFESVEQMVPDFKHTRRYLHKIDIYIAKTSPAPIVAAAPAPMAVVTSPVAVVKVPVAPAPVAPQIQPAAMPAQVPVAVSLEDQQKQAQEIAALAEKSAQLYRQIADVADDNSTKQTRQKMAQVDEIMNNLKENKEHLLHQMQEEQFKRQQEEQKAKEAQRRAQIEKLYHDGIEYLRSHDYENANVKFLELENFSPDYRATRRYLKIVDEGLRKMNIEAVTGYEKREAKHLEQLQNKENAVDLLRAQKEDEKARKIEQDEQIQLQGLAQKASDINDDIIRLSKGQDYEAMKAKFSDLENTVTALTTLKDEMAKQKDRQEREKELTSEAQKGRQEMLEAQKREDQQIHAYYSAQPLNEYRPELSSQPSNLDQYKRREIMQEQNTLFSEGVDRYENKKYTQAKLLFGELAAQHDRRAEVWLKKVDRAITQQLLKSEESEERERTAFIADQVKAQRELIIIQERERQRQKKLTEELERQRRLYEDDRALQLRKEETMKAQERERQRQEEKRLRLEAENEKKQEMLRFHKIVTVVPAPPAPTKSVNSSEAKQSVIAPPAVSVPAAPPVVVSAPVAVKSPPPVMTPREKERQARIQAAEEARQKRIEERQKEKEHQQELKAQREADRQAMLKAKAEQAAKEEKRREELLRQQEEQRQEKIRQDEIIREETQRRQEMEQQERQQQAQLEAQREVVRKQLEAGVEAMYQDALNSYQQGDYSAAADRFKDVQDIIPGYKQSEQYMEEARQKSLIEKPQAVVSPTTTPAQQDNVSKALDLFDPNAK